jgi:hypothetical protein
MDHLQQQLQPYFFIVDTPLKLVSTSLLILIIVYSSVVPMKYKDLANSMIGRALSVAIVYGVTVYLGWIHGLLTALAFLLVLHGGHLVSNEGFDGGGTVSEKKVVGNRWWVEKVLGEVPSSIAIDRVMTSVPGDT